MVGCPDRIAQEICIRPAPCSLGGVVVTASASPIGPVPKRRRGPKAVEVPVPLETAEQTAFVRWFRLAFPKVLMFSVPNGSHLAGTPARRAAQMARLKAEGLVEGVPDLHIPAWSLWVEMKRSRDGRLSEAQGRIIADLRALGDTVIIARGWQDALGQVLAFVACRGGRDMARAGAVRS